MNILKTKIYKILLVYFLAIALTAGIMDGLDDFAYGLSKVKAIGNCTQSSDSDSADGRSIKSYFNDKAVQDQWLCDHTLISDYSSICMESWSPREAHLPTKADRAPPQ